VSDAYAEFIARKLAHQVPTGIPDPPPMNERLKPHQQHCTRWALQRGRAALFQDPGLGKTWQGLEWAAKVTQHTHKPVLVLCPLAVAGQWVREGQKLWGEGWGPVPTLAREMSDIDGERPVSYVTNYDRLDKLKELLPRLGGVVLDESSLIKNATGKTRTQLIESFRHTHFKLCLTATPSPNDPAELGNHAEFLGVMRHVDMLQRFFEHDAGDTGTWVLKGHARKAFWRWCSTWAMCLRRPSDLGYSDEGYELPPLEWHEHVVDVGALDTGERQLSFAVTYEAASLGEQRKVRRDSLETRVAKAAALVNADREQWIVWAALNPESEALTKAIDGAIEVTGSQSIDEKEDRITRFLAGEARVLVTKMGICGFGLNCQQVAKQLFVGIEHSFEQQFQAVRRSFRFGQTRAVQAHQLRTSADGRIVANLRRKQEEFERMHAEMAAVLREGCDAA
jgi:superfamily II DNA or RNA helicase